MSRTYEYYKEENKRQLEEDRISDLIGLTDYQEKIKEIQEEIDTLHLMDLEDIKEEYGVNSTFEALIILHTKYDEMVQRLEDFINENKNDDDCE